MPENNPPKRFNPFMPLIMAALLIAGVFIGTKLNFGSKSVVFIPGSHGSDGKLEKVLDFIERNYVDTIDRQQLEDKTLTAMLNSLDPHSGYIEAKELQQVNEPLQGNFEGIGIEFNILNDTISVVTPINGGPSEKAGIIAGDKIISVDEKKVAGIKINNKMVFEKLRGKHGTKVKLAVKRNGNPQLLDFVITRDEIPIYSVDIAYMLNTNTGYIKISRFAANTFQEYLNAFKQLSKKGMQKLVIDLRGNGGGYLNAAVDLADEFLSKGMEIVYTQGKASPKKQYTATDKGGFENATLVILLDEGSASASEILAGAIQDNDRGILIGRRSFGKGLVQEQLELPDGSALRLTTARYYTPSGRCIQKPYTNGNDAYFNEEYERYSNGELLHADSVKVTDSLKYHTVGGKVVYGGGGVTPDIFVPMDTSFRSTWLTKVSYTGLITEFAYEYVDKNRAALKKYGSGEQFMKQFNLNQATIDQFISYSQKKEIKGTDREIKKSQNYLSLQLKALIGRNLYGNEVYYPVLHTGDKTVQTAIEALSRVK